MASGLFCVIINKGIVYAPGSQASSPVTKGVKKGLLVVCPQATREEKEKEAHTGIILLNDFGENTREGEILKRSVATPFEILNAM